MGCTLHEVDETVDGGRILMQVACRVDPAWPIAQWQKRAYLMKIYCGLVWVCLSCSDTNHAAPVNASHGIRPEWLKKFLLLQSEESQEIIAA